MYSAGWIEDIHDPHNWYQPYTIGAYGAYLNLPDDVSAQFRDLLQQGLASADNSVRDGVYKQINQLYYDDAIATGLSNATGHGYEQRWVQGRLLNPIFPGLHFYEITKSGSPDDTTFTEASFGGIDTLDPALAYDTASGEVIQNVYETLVFYDGEATDQVQALVWLNRGRYL